MRQKIKIGPYNWTFIDNSSKTGRDNLGLCEYSKLLILISNKIPPDVKKVTILHELLHAFFDSSGLQPKDEENIVDTLANQLLLFIQNNPEFFKKYILDE